MFFPPKKIVALQETVESADRPPFSNWQFMGRNASLRVENTGLLFLLEYKVFCEAGNAPHDRPLASYVLFGRRNRKWMLQGFMDLCERKQ
jgi:hypothetical protein